MRYGVIGFVPGYMGQMAASENDVDFGYAMSIPNTIVYGVKWHDGNPAFIVDGAELLFRYILGWITPNHPIGTPLILYAQKSGDRFSMLFTVSIESIVERFKKEGPELGPEDQVFVVNKYVHYEGKISERANNFFGKDTTTVCFIDVKDIRSESGPIQMYRLENINVSYDLNGFPGKSIIVEIKTPKSEMM